MDSDEPQGAADSGRLAQRQWLEQVGVKPGAQRSDEQLLRYLQVHDQHPLGGSGSSGAPNLGDIQQLAVDLVVWSWPGPSVPPGITRGQLRRVLVAHATCTTTADPDAGNATAVAATQLIDSEDQVACRV